MVESAVTMDHPDNPVYSAVRIDVSEVITSCDSKVLVLSRESSARDVISTLLRKLKMRHHDSGRFVIEAELVTKREIGMLQFEGDDMPMYAAELFPKGALSFYLRHKLDMDSGKTKRDSDPGQKASITGHQLTIQRIRRSLEKLKRKSSSASASASQQQGGSLSNSQHGAVNDHHQPPSAKPTSPSNHVITADEFYREPVREHRGRTTRSRRHHSDATQPPTATQHSPTRSDSMYGGGYKHSHRHSGLSPTRSENIGYSPGGFKSYSALPSPHLAGSPTRSDGPYKTSTLPQGGTVVSMDTDCMIFYDNASDAGSIRSMPLPVSHGTGLLANHSVAGASHVSRAHVVVPQPKPDYRSSVPHLNHQHSPGKHHATPGRHPTTPRKHTSVMIDKPAKMAFRNLEDSGIDVKSPPHLSGGSHGANSHSNGHNNGHRSSHLSGSIMQPVKKPHRRRHFSDNGTDNGAMDNNSISRSNHKYRGRIGSDDLDKSANSSSHLDSTCDREIAKTTHNHVISPQDSQKSYLSPTLSDSSPFSLSGLEGGGEVKRSGSFSSMKSLPVTSTYKDISSTPNSFLFEPIEGETSNLRSKSQSCTNLNSNKVVRRRSLPPLDVSQEKLEQKKTSLSKRLARKINKYRENEKRYVLPSPHSFTPQAGQRAAHGGEGEEAATVRSSSDDPRQKPRVEPLADDMSLADMEVAEILEGKPDHPTDSDVEEYLACVESTSPPSANQKPAGSANHAAGKQAAGKQHQGGQKTSDGGASKGVDMEKSGYHRYSNSAKLERQQRQQQSQHSNYTSPAARMDDQPPSPRKSSFTSPSGSHKSYVQSPTSTHDRPELPPKPQHSSFVSPVNQGGHSGLGGQSGLRKQAYVSPILSKKAAKERLHQYSTQRSHEGQASYPVSPPGVGTSAYLVSSAAVGPSAYPVSPTAVGSRPHHLSYSSTAGINLTQTHAQLNNQHHHQNNQHQSHMQANHMVSPKSPTKTSHHDPQTKPIVPANKPPKKLLNKFVEQSIQSFLDHCHDQNMVGLHDTLDLHQAALHGHIPTIGLDIPDNLPCSDPHSPHKPEGTGSNPQLYANNYSPSAKFLPGGEVGSIDLHRSPIPQRTSQSPASHTDVKGQRTEGPMGERTAEYGASTGAYSNTGTTRDYTTKHSANTGAYAHTGTGPQVHDDDVFPNTVEFSINKDKAPVITHNENASDRKVPVKSNKTSVDDVKHSGDTQIGDSVLSDNTNVNYERGSSHSDIVNGNDINSKRGASNSGDIKTLHVPSDINSNIDPERSHQGDIIKPKINNYLIDETDDQVTLKNDELYSIDLALGRVDGNQRNSVTNDLALSNEDSNHRNSVNKDMVLDSVDGNHKNSVNNDSHRSTGNTTGFKVKSADNLNLRGRNDITNHLSVSQHVDTDHSDTASTSSSTRYKYRSHAASDSANQEADDSTKGKTLTLFSIIRSHCVFCVSLEKGRSASYGLRVARDRLTRADTCDAYSVVVVRELSAGSPAEASCLVSAGDIVVEVNGHSVLQSSEKVVRTLLDARSTLEMVVARRKHTQAGSLPSSQEPVSLPTVVALSPEPVLAFDNMEDIIDRVNSGTGGNSVMGGSNSQTESRLKAYQTIIHDQSDTGNNAQGDTSSTFSSRSQTYHQGEAEEKHNSAKSCDNYVKSRDLNIKSHDMHVKSHDRSHGMNGDVNSNVLLMNHIDEPTFLL